MRHSESIKELAGALAKAQAEFGRAQLDAQNPHFRNSYATLTSIVEACRGPLSKNSLALVQTIITKEGKPSLETMLLHASGEWMGFDFDLYVDKPTMQGLGSAITYARRYGIQTLLGIVADEDDDGNASEPARPQASNGKGNAPAPQAAARPALPKAASDRLADFIVPIGTKFIGQPLKNVPKETLSKWVLSMMDEDQRNPKSGAHREFMLKAKEYLEQEMGQ